MLLSKANLYPLPDQLTSTYARALTHPARLEIIRSLRKESSRTVHQLASTHPITLPALSQHLEILRDLQIITFQPIRPFLLYSIEEDKYKEACESLIRYLNEQY